jgi:zinc and cadmium transporter
VLSTSLESLAAVVGVQLLAAAAVVSLHRRERGLRHALPFVVSAAVGVLLGTGAMHLMPEAIEALGNRESVWLTLVGTILTLYTFERVFHLASGISSEPAADSTASHQDAHHHHASKPATLLLGCLTHSLVDGTSVAAAFAVDRRAGWATALAVGLHEVPHRLGDFALLLHMGQNRGRAAFLAVAAGASSLLGWAFVVALGAHGTRPVEWLLPVSAGSFLYIALVDLLPELNSEQRAGAVVWQIVCLVLGVALAVALTHLPGA